MNVEELIALLVAELKDDVKGAIVREGNTVKVVFGDGTTRTVTVA